MSGYRNYEGYCDPTAGSAISECRRKEKSDRGKVVRKTNTQARRKEDGSGRATVFICSPYAGDTVRNILAAQKYCRYAVDRGYIPFAPHLFFTQFLDDEDPAERSLGISFGNAFMDKCFEVWIFGTEYSAGMRAEYERAVRKGYRIRHFTTDCREITASGNGENQDGRI